MSTLHDLTAWFGGLWGQTVATSNTTGDRLAEAAIPAAVDAVEAPGADIGPAQVAHRGHPFVTVEGAVAVTGLGSQTRRTRGRKRTTVAVSPAHATAFAALGQRPHRGTRAVGTGAARRTLRIDAAEPTIGRPSAHIDMRAGRSDAADRPVMAAPFAVDATLLPLGQTIPAKIFGLGQRDAWRLTASGGQVLRLELVGYAIDAGFRVTVEVCDAHGHRLATLAAGRHAVALPAAGDYVLVIADEVGSRRGNYTLKASLVVPEARVNRPR